MQFQNFARPAGLLALALTGAGAIQLAGAASVTVDGQPFATSVAPIQRNGRTLLPMRDIFEELGASVRWDNASQRIAATHGATNIGLQIGNRAATVNGQGVELDQPAILYRGVTMVPLRFVAQSLGANVNWNNATEVAAITTAPGSYAARPQRGQNVGGQAVAGARQISVPAGAVVKVTLDNALSSATTHQGDRFSSTVVSHNAGESEFPAGSKLEGVVSDVTSQNGDTPGMLDLDFQSVVLPGGRRYPLQGTLTSLDANSVDTSTPGRIMGKAGSGKNNKLVVVGIGAGVGFVLGKLIKKNTTLTTLLGGVAGYILGQKQDKKNQPTEAVLPTNVELGVRLGQGLSYADANGYFTQRSQYYKM